MDFFNRKKKKKSKKVIGENTSGTKDEEKVGGQVVQS